MRSVLSPAGGIAFAIVLAGTIFPAQAHAQSQFRNTLNSGEQATRRAEQIQQQIDELDDERSDLVGELRTLVQRRDSAQLYVLQQESAVAAQEAEIASLTDQLTRVDDITAQTIPMMIDMIADLERFVAADLPFKADVRQARIQRLKDAMDNPQVPTAEAYRLIIEAYQTEMEYGNTIDTWKEDVIVDGNPVKVDMFQYGRVALVYVTPDRRKAARFDRATREWQPLEGQYVDDVAFAIDVAEKREQQKVLAAPVQKFVVAN